MLDVSRRDDVMWLVATYDVLVGQPESAERNEDLAKVQRWLCRVTGMNSLSAAVDAARRLTRHQVSFIAPVQLPPPPGAGRQVVPPPRGESPPLQPRSPGRRRRVPEPREDDRPAVPGRRRHPEPSGVVPRLDDETAFRAEALLKEFDSWHRRRRTLTAGQQRKVDTLRDTILDLTGFATIGAARAAVQGYIKRRDGARHFVPTKGYAQDDGGPPRPLPPVQIVRGGAPGSGGRR
ncbi:hypothetical protein CU254_41175 (plasmid) [Amycolatopsis sp. AA4]|uniref:hypothetical protein n=1 Tax=Actinomycetes TaxID=1760 RepID=UPI0001B55C34|nr:hypothetical protein [Amycolatopsis sp. AA4]ATY17004.1 hypothetical protein CU254_41175 [Amycolatopsis sp. AA4]EFL12507.1 hypothetical protein SSMG_08178 [Streptomyces sp. AA4]